MYTIGIGDTYNGSILDDLYQLSKLCENKSALMEASRRLQVLVDNGKVSVEGYNHA